MNLLIQAILNAESLSLDSSISESGYMESDVPVKHRGGSLEDKWNMESQSGDRSDLET